MRMTEKPAPSRFSSARVFLRAGVAGAVAGGVGIATSELLAGLIPGAPSLVVGVGSFIIALQPPGAKDVVVSLFGTNDKLVVNIAVVLVALMVATAAGILGRRSFDYYFQNGNLHMIVLNENGATYWVTTTLDNYLSNETMKAIAGGLRPVGGRIHK